MKPAPVDIPTITAPATPGACATLACIWEATAPKPGNVYRGADFEDLTYVDFLVSASVIGPVLDQARQLGVGTTVLQAVEATRQAVATNTNLGMLLLITPLAAVPQDFGCNDGVTRVLESFSLADSEQVYAAIRTAMPGGLGSVEEGDVHATECPPLPLLDAMQLAAERDLVARQYTNGFREVFLTADWLAAGLESRWSLSESIVHAFLRLLAQYPDSLIARKCGQRVAEEVAHRAKQVLACGTVGEAGYERALGDLDFWLRMDGHQRNPGTSADLVAAGLFVLLRDQRLKWPVRFYPLTPVGT